MKETPILYEIMKQWSFLTQGPFLDIDLNLNWNM